MKNTQLEKAIEKVATITLLIEKKEISLIDTYKELLEIEKILLELKDNKRIKKIIYNWVKSNFGESEAADPSYNLDLLSKEIAKKI